MTTSMATRTVRLVALGDSVTAGIGDAGLGNQRLGWSAHVAHALGARDFVNLAEPGARARDVLGRQLPEALRLNPTVATLLVGGNDVLRRDFDSWAVGTQVAACVQALTQVGCDVLVSLLHDPEFICPLPAYVRHVLSLRARGVNEAIKECVGTIPGAVLIDPTVMPESRQRAAWHVDRMHPGPLGHRALARVGVRALSELGWIPRAKLPQEPMTRPATWKSVGWLIAVGLPWLAKRSFDFVPELTFVCLKHRKECQRNLLECV